MNKRHALGPKLESSPLIEIPPAAAGLTQAKAAKTTTLGVAATTTMSRVAASMPQEFQCFAETPPAVVHVKPVVKPPAVQVSVIGAKAMHKTLKGSNEVIVRRSSRGSSRGRGNAPSPPCVERVSESNSRLSINE